MSNLPHKNRNLLWKILLVAVVLYVPVFLHLENLAIRLWDEARLANNAHGMFLHGNYFIPHYMGQPDMWNTKPPLMVWLQTLCFHLMGPGELSVRLPSALAAVGTAFMLIAFSLRYLKSYWFGFIAVLILITSQGYIGLHVSRTGDYDALLTFFTTAYLIAIYLYFQSRSTKYLHFFFIALGLSILTKSIQGMLFLPAIALFVFYKRNHWSIFRNKWLYIDTVLLLLVVFGYYLGREYINPGYLNAVWLNELGGRYATTLEGHRHGFFYYFTLLSQSHFSIWIWLLPLGLLSAILGKNKRLNKLVMYCLGMSIIYWLIISLSATKLEWYDAPLIPLLSLVAGYPIYVVFHYIKSSNISRKGVFPIILSFTFLIAVFSYPYYRIAQSVYNPSPATGSQRLYHISYYLKNKLKTEAPVDNLKICYYYTHKAHVGHILFYLQRLNNRGNNVTFSDWKELTAGEKVIANQPDVKNYIEQHYRFKVLDTFLTTKTYLINGTK